MAEPSWAPFSMLSSGEGSGDCLMGAPCFRAGITVERAGPDSSVVVVPGVEDADHRSCDPPIGEESDSADDEHVEWNGLAGGINSYEADLKYAYASQQVYLICDVNVRGLHVPGQDRAEVLAFGMIANGQASWDQLQRLMTMLPADPKVRWAPTENSSAHEIPPKRFTVGVELWQYGWGQQNSLAPFLGSPACSRA